MKRRSILLLFTLLPLAALAFSGYRLYERIEQMKQIRAIVDELAATVRQGGPVTNQRLVGLSPMLFDDLRGAMKTGYAARVDLHPNIWFNPAYTHTATIAAGNHRSVIRLHAIEQTRQFQVVEQEVVQRIEP